MVYNLIIGRDAADKAQFGDRGLIYLGKSYVKMGNYTSLSNKLWMDIARSHVVLVAGKRGSGKCLHEDTLITLDNGLEIPIKCLANNKDKILSLNEKLKIEQTEKSDFFSRKVEKLIKLRLRSGKEIKLTPEHPLLTIKGWEETQKLGIGSRIATPRTLNSFGDKEMPLDEIKLLAYLIAEGHTKSIVLFSNADEKIVNDFRESLKAFDNSLELIKEQENHYRISSPSWRNIVLSGNEKRNERGQFTKENKNVYKKRSIRELIEREGIFNKLATQKTLSKSIMQLKKENLSIFLNRLFSCDGSIYNSGNYWEISYACSSEIMIRQIQSLLVRFGILSKLRNKIIKLNEKEFKAFELVLNEESSLKFINEIGFFGKKEDRTPLARQEILQRKKNPNVDTVPKEVWEIYKPRNWAEVGRQLGYKHPKAMRERIHYSPSRHTLMQIAKVEQSNPLMLLAQSDIFWDEIISMEILEGEFTVYDISVPNNHNFVANNIIVHNSYSLGVIAEELANLPAENAKNVASLIFDTMGIFWTMKYKNEKDIGLLKDWNLETKNLPIKVFVPFGKVEEYRKKNIPFDATFALKASELDSEDWITIFNLDITSLPGVLIQRIVSKLKENKKDFSLNDIQTLMETDERASKETKEVASSMFGAADTWGIFSKDDKGIEVSDLVNAGTTTVLDTSVYSSVGAYNVRALVISLICRKIFNSRMDSRKKEEMNAIQHGQDYLSYKAKDQDPLVWIFVDEAHEFLVKEGKTPASDALIQLLREGRQPGISLVLATQQPGQIHKDVMTQSDIVIAHRLTAKADIDALNEIMQTYVLGSIQKNMNDLPSLKGSAILLDDNSERIYPVRIRPRFTWHGGEAPTSLKANLKL
ncbi:MAG: LAGLIDADG family homing endonuclease [archaeon]